MLLGKATFETLLCLKKKKIERETWVKNKESENKLLHDVSLARHNLTVKFLSRSDNALS